MHIQGVGRAAVMPQIDQAQIIGRDVAGLPADLELQILFPQREVGVHHVADQRELYAVARLFGGQILRLGSFVQPPQASP